MVHSGGDVARLTEQHVPAAVLNLLCESGEVVFLAADGARVAAVGDALVAVVSLHRLQSVAARQARIAAPRSRAGDDGVRRALATLRRVDVDVMILRARQATSGMQSRDMLLHCTCT